MKNTINTIKEIVAIISANEVEYETIKGINHGQLSVASKALSLTEAGMPIDEAIETSIRSSISVFADTRYIHGNCDFIAAEVFLPDNLDFEKDYQIIKAEVEHLLADVVGISPVDYTFWTGESSFFPHDVEMVFEYGTDETEEEGFFIESEETGVSIGGKKMSRCYGSDDIRGALVVSLSGEELWLN